MIFHARRLTRWLVVGGIIGALVTWSLRQMFPEIGLWIVKAFVFRLITVNEPVARFGRQVGVPFLGILFNNALVAAACYAILPIAQWLNPLEVERFPRGIRRWTLKEEGGQVPWIERVMFWWVTKTTGGWFTRIKALAVRRMFSMVYFLPAFILGLQGFYTGVVFGLSDSWLYALHTAMAIGPHAFVEFPAIMAFAGVPLSAALLVKEKIELEGEESAFSALEGTRGARSTVQAVMIGGCLLIAAAAVEHFVTPRLLASLFPT